MFVIIDNPQPQRRFTGTMPKAVRLLYRGDVCKKSFDLRLKEEGRWKEFVVERDRLAQTLGRSSKQLDELLLTKYGKGVHGTANGTKVLEVPEKIKDGEKVGDLSNEGKGKTDGAYSDRLPDGCPLWRKEDFSKSDTRFYDDVMWAEKNLARSDLNEENLHDNCPSLSCARYFWSSRYTKRGYDKHAETVALFTTRDKNALSNESKRRDSGGTLEALADFLDGLANRDGDDSSGGSED
jgi:hypothetical protein